MPTADHRARRIVVRGRVQGVGFRPFIHRLAEDLGLTGRVWNTSGRVTILAAGSAAALHQLENRVINDAPPLARPELMTSEPWVDQHWGGFEIAESVIEQADVSVPPDVGLCADCRSELADPDDRRYRYPFINCTQCGPRFTIIDTMPYDRMRTSMAEFELCRACRAEYEDPRSRRFHAEPIACPTCGPALSFEDRRGHVADTNVALDGAITLLTAGRIVAIKGLGGYHLVCDATNATAVARLRERKQRPTKPLAVMIKACGSDGLDAVREEAIVTPAISAALVSPERPIVLARRRPGSSLARVIAPGLEEVGVLLPYTAIHILLLDALGTPLVVTSGNPTGEPLAIYPEQARTQLAAVADAWVHSNRAIRRRADDSVVREIAGAVRPLRLGRGYAPLELVAPRPFSEPVLAVGGHMKNAIALGFGARIVVSPHVGDLDTVDALTAFENRIAELQALYDVAATRVLCDAHPDYASTRWAKTSGLPVTEILHHHAHAAAAAGEPAGDLPQLVFTWDGVGLGADRTSWGGELFYGQPGNWQRVASLRPFRVPGAVHAGREPWRARAAVAWEVGRAAGIESAALDIARQAWVRDVGCHATSAVGRLFDAAASWILGLQRYGHEAQGPTELEALATGVAGPDLFLPLAEDSEGVVRIDWEPLVEFVSDDSIDKPTRAAALHQSLIGAAVRLVESLHLERGPCRVGLGGGVFHNRVLTEGLIAELSARGVPVRLSSNVPLGDGGLAFGQLVEFLGSQA